MNSNASAAADPAPLLPSQRRPPERPAGPLPLPAEPAQRPRPVPVFPPILCPRGRHRLRGAARGRRGPVAAGLLAAAAALFAGHQAAAGGLLHTPAPPVTRVDDAGLT